MKGHRFAFEGVWRSSSVAGLTVGVLFAAWRYGVLWQLPVWDGAMGVSPAAITLERLDFDVSALLQMDDYRSGGPNLHAFSAYTWFVALMVRFSGSYLAALPWLHVASFAVLAILAAGTHRAARVAGVGPGGAALATALAVLFPPMVVQASDVYLDLPLAAATIWVFAFALDERWAAAILAASIGAAVKPSAVIVLPVLAWLIVDHPDTRWRRLAGLSLPTAIAVVPLLMDRAMRATTIGTEVTVKETTLFTLLYMSTMPILILLVLAVAALHLSGRRSERNLRSRRLSTAALLLVVSFLLFFFLNPIASKGVSGLPRYTTMLSPLLAAALVATSDRVLRGRYRSAPAAVFLVLFLANMSGSIEPPSTNRYPLAERSLAYEKMLGVQQAALSRFEEVGRHLPTYYDHFTHYRLSYPETGWSRGPLADGTPVRITPGAPWRDVTNWPEAFALLIEAEWLGGQELADIKRRAAASQAWSVETETFQEGEFKNEVVVVRRIDTGVSPGAKATEAGSDAPTGPGS